jgi:hypothetical protein
VSFLNGSLAPWLLAISIPIVIHLLTRQAARTYVLPTFRFLARSVARQSNIFRIRHLLLLVLRALLVALLVLVFLKPRLLAPLGPPPASGRRVVLVVDVSLSMGYRRGGVTSLKEAQAQAERILEGLSGGDRASLIVAGAAPTVGSVAFAEGVAAVRQRIRELRPTQETCDVSGAVALAAEQIRKAGGRSELYLISDFQRANWADVKLDDVPRDTQVVFVGTDDDARDNVAVTGIRLRPPSARAGEPVTALVEIWNGSAAPRTMPVTFRQASDAPRTTSVTVPPYSSGTALFPLSFPAPGRYVCTATLGGDALEADNTRWYVADLQHSLTVCVLTDENAAASPNGSYFVSRALNPTPDQPGGIRVLPRRGAELTDADLRVADSVVLCNVSMMPADRMPALLKYVQGGGSLVVFLCGDHVQAQMEALNRLAGASEGLPFVPTQPMDVRGRGKGYVTLAEARYESRLLRVFKDPSAADLGKIQFSRFFLTTEVDGRAETLLKFEDGTPAAARRGIGTGSVLLLNFSPSPRDSDLAKQEVFPPLLHEMLKGLTTPEGDRRDFTPGGSASATITPTRERVVVTGPAGVEPGVTLDRAGGAVVLDRARQAGVYVIESGGRESGMFAVNVSPDESDLRSIDPRELQSRQNRSPTYLVGSGRGPEDASELTRSRPLWPYLVIALFALLILEQLLASLEPKSRPIV